jgi:hypothetical protein
MPVPRARSGAREDTAQVSSGTPAGAAHRVGAASGRHLAFVAHVRGHRPLHSKQAGVAERLDDVAVWA